MNSHHEVLEGRKMECTEEFGSTCEGKEEQMGGGEE